MGTTKSNDKAKKLKYVRIYDQLYKMLEDGTYPPGSQLPGETELSERMNVSRMTLRKALALLNEDGIISSRSGIGHFVGKRRERSHGQGMEKIGSPIRKCCTLTLDNFELEFRIEPPSDYMIDVLGKKSAAIVIVNRYYKNEGNVVAHALSFVPIEIIGQNNIDLNDSLSLGSFLDQEIYSDAQTARYTISHSKAGNFAAGEYKLSDNDSFALIQESLQNTGGETISVSKYYIPVEHFLMDLNLNSARE